MAFHDLKDSIIKGIIPPGSCAVQHLRSGTAAEPIRFCSSQRCVLLPASAAARFHSIIVPVIPSSPRQFGKTSAFCQMPEHSAVTQHGADRAEQEVDCKTNIKQVVHFQNNFKKSISPCAVKKNDSEILFTDRF